MNQRLIDSGLVGEVSRGEKILYPGTDPESYITENTLVYEKYYAGHVSKKARAGELLCTCFLS